MPTKAKRSKKATKTAKRTKVSVKPAKETRAAIKSSGGATPGLTRSKEARANISEGTRLYSLAARLTKGRFVKVYGQKGPQMTWGTACDGGGCSSGEVLRGAKGEIGKYQKVGQCCRGLLNDSWGEL